MKWIVAVFVNFLHENGQGEMWGQRDNHFTSGVAWEFFVEETRRFFIDETNEVYQRNDKDFMIRCPTLEKFETSIADEELYRA